mmetsp:Transcript_26301/g.73515  ORF Transcript_26301/g.73515 Transcript_26301/m.73515 type:complete len:205 (+) Transcript_26301:343-957(+)
MSATIRRRYTSVPAGGLWHTIQQRARYVALSMSYPAFRSQSYSCMAMVVAILAKRGVVSLRLVETFRMTSREHGASIEKSGYSDRICFSSLEAFRRQSNFTSASTASTHAYSAVTSLLPDFLTVSKIDRICHSCPDLSPSALITCGAALRFTLPFEGKINDRNSLPDKYRWTACMWTYESLSHDRSWSRTSALSPPKIRRRSHT